jgi:hypothetical protein
MKESIQDKLFPLIRPLPYTVLHNITVFAACSTTLAACSEISAASREGFGGAPAACGVFGVPLTGKTKTLPISATALTIAQSFPAISRKYRRVFCLLKKGRAR